MGKEIVSRIRVPFFRNNETFYTDSNGREMLKRVLNYRPSFQLKDNVENVSGNYYPITSRITLTDNTTRFSMLNDRSQGGSSLQSGEIELMVFLKLCFKQLLLKKKNSFSEQNAEKTRDFAEPRCWDIMMEIKNFPIIYYWEKSYSSDYYLKLALFYFPGNPLRKPGFFLQ